MIKPPKVYRTGGGWGGLGDCWLFCSVMAWESVGHHPVHFWNHSARQNLREIWGLFDVEAPLVPVRRKPRSAPYLLDGLHPRSVFSCPVYPTMRRWRPGGTALAVQYSGVSFPMKNFTKQARADFERRLAKRRIPTVDVDGKESLVVKMQRMSRCAAFVGIPSGMSLVALSMGMPTFVIANGLPLNLARRVYRSQPNAQVFQDHVAFLSRDRPTLI
jgi:hypothetical protein